MNFSMGEKWAMIFKNYFHPGLWRRWMYSSVCACGGMHVCVCVGVGVCQNPEAVTDFTLEETWEKATAAPVHSGVKVH